MKRDKLFFLVQPIFKSLPYQWGLFLRNRIYPYFFKKVGRNLKIFEGCIFKYPSEIELGDNVTINQNCFIAAKGGLVMGDDIMMGSGCKIVTSSHNAYTTSVPMREQGMTFEKITIGNDVWFGFNVIILPGCSVGNGVILAAGCVLAAKDTGNYTIWGGVPAKQIAIRKNEA